MIICSVLFAIAHLVTYEKATTWTIGQVMELVTRRYSKEMGGHLKALYDRLKIGYNKYVELIGGAIGAGACAAVKQGNKVYTIADDIPLLHFLTGLFLFNLLNLQQGLTHFYTTLQMWNKKNRVMTGCTPLLPTLLLPTTWP